MVLFFLCFAFINLLSLTFNIFLFYLIIKLNDKARHPTIYIYNAILANSMDTFMIFLTFLLPLLLDDHIYLELRRLFGSTLTLIGTFSYEHTFYLTIIMVIHRIHVVRKPTSNFFSATKIWAFCGGFGVISLILLLIPYFSKCPVNINQRLFLFAVDCENRHPITQFENDWLFLIPVFTLCLNVVLILYLAQKRGEALRRRRLNVVSISSTSNAHHQLPPLMNTKSKIRQAYEYSLLLQSIFTTGFLAIYELSGLLLRLFAKEYQTVSIIVQQYVFYIRLSFSSLLCFLVFFIGTPTIRKLIIEKVKEIYKGKVVVRSPTTTVLV